MRKFVSVAALLALGLLSTGNARAEVAVGANFGIAQFDYPDVDDGSARTFHAAWQVQESPLFFEFALIDSGDADIAGTAAVTMNVAGNQFGLGYRAVSNQQTGSGYYFRGGVYNTDTEVSDPNGELCGFPCRIKDGNNGLYIGIGGDLMFNPSFGVRFDLQGLLGVEDFADDKSVTFISIGPVIRFGATE